MIKENVGQLIKTKLNDITASDTPSSPTQKEWKKMEKPPPNNNASHKKLKDGLRSRQKTKGEYDTFQDPR